MRPESDTEGPSSRPPTRRPPGVAPATPGSRIARERIARYAGLGHLRTPRVAADALARAARQLGISPAVARTLAAMLAAYGAAWGLRRPPVLAATNAQLACRAGCDPRTVQKHLALLRRRGLVAIDYGPLNSRRPCDADGGGDGTVGIDLRPAIVAAEEAVAGLRALDRARARFARHLRQARADLLHARAAVADTSTVSPDRAREAAAGLERLDLLRDTLGRLRRRVERPSATVAGVEEACAGAERVAAEARRVPEVPAAAGDKAADETADPSSRDVVSGVLETESDFIEPVVHQARGQDLSDGSAPPSPVLVAHSPPGEPRPAVPDYDVRDGDRAGHQGPTMADLVELELEARQRARVLGLASRLFNEAVGRHGVSDVIRAVGHVWAIRTRPAVRSPVGLLVSLLRRPPGALAEGRLAGPFHPRPPLDEREALAIARGLAPSHRAEWVVERFRATAQRRGEPITDERRCLEGFARKCQRDHVLRAA
jgi:hypothetical protein